MSVLTGKRNKLIYSLLHYDFIQYTTVYEYMSILDFHRDWSYRNSTSPELSDKSNAKITSINNYLHRRNFGIFQSFYQNKIFLKILYNFLFLYSSCMDLLILGGELSWTPYSIKQTEVDF